MRLGICRRVVPLGLVLSLLVTGCSDGGDDDSPSADPSAGSTADAAESTKAITAAPPLALTDADALAVAATYADLVHRAYSDAAVGAEELRTSVQALVGTPSEATLAAARQTWISARALYGPTEAFRFYEGPIDAVPGGPEPRINAWPIDESYIDHTVDSPGGIVNDVANVPEVNLPAVIAADRAGNENNVSTGWHVIEFLLWGQDTNDDGPGARPASDFDAAANSDRRRTYLTLLVDLLVADLGSVRDAWAPGAPYREVFVSDPVGAVEKILQGMGTLSAGEMAGKRLGVPAESRAPDDEQSRFSDNTHNDVFGNMRGIRLAYTAEHEGVEGTSLSDVVAALDPALDADMRKQLNNNVAAAEALAAPFDQLIKAPDDDPARQELTALIVDLQDQGEAIASLASRLGLEITIEL